MTEDTRLTLTRRRALAALGGVGLASAGAGLGTSAYFSDVETATDNRLIAGELDLLLDWEEHYSDWRGAETAVEVVHDRPADPAGYTPVPTAAAPVLWVADEDVDTFMHATAVEAFPDTDTHGTADDGLQDAVPTDAECAYLRQHLRADGAWISALDADARTQGEVNGQRTEPGDPLVSLTDVKPGDFGEVTFSIHLCDNPGYVWATGELTADAENGLTEPEAEVDTTPEAGELAERTLAALWYDTGPDGTYEGERTDGEGDNIHQPAERVLLKGPLRQVLDVLSTYEPGVPLDGEPATTAPVPPTVPPAPGSGTVSGAADATPALACETVAGNPDCADLGLLEAIKIEAGDDETAGQLAVGDYVTPAGTVTVEDFDVPAGTVTLSTDFPAAAVITKGGPAGRVCRADGDTDGTPLEEGDAVTLDGVTFQTPEHPVNGSIPGLSHVSVCYGVDGPDDPGPDPEPSDPPARDRQCFPASTTAYVGFAWWLPRSVGNEVQTDSVSFDLGFYTEQCRHNDGETPGTTTGDGTDDEPS